MKGVIRHIICAAAILLTIGSRIGFGIHCCNAEGATYFVPMFGDTSCEAIHQHHHDHHHDCPAGRSGHCNGCHGCDAVSSPEDDCTTSLFVVTDAQISNDGSQETGLAAVVTMLSTVPAPVLAQVSPFSSKSFSPPVPFRPDRPSLSVWRL